MKRVLAHEAALYAALETLAEDTRKKMIVVDTGPCCDVMRRDEYDWVLPEVIVAPVVKEEPYYRKFAKRRGKRY